MWLRDTYINPAETGLFYLNSRYYDPEVGRFISADTEDVLSADHQNFAQYNLYAYCWNNPVNMSDENGDWPSWATATLGVVGVSLCVAAVAVLSGGVALGPVLGAVVTGAAKGALIGAAVGSAAGAGVGYAKTKTLTGTLKGATIGLGVGAIAGAVIGASSSGLKYAKTNGVSIKKVGKLKSSNHPGDSQWGVKYTVKKANGSSTTRSLEFHYNHKHKGYKLHWQQNKWNTRFNASHGDKYWTWWGKRITNGK